MKNPFASDPCPKYKPVDPPPFPRFCGRCGSPLTAVCDQIGYDERTGEPKFYRWLRCPKWDGGITKLLSADYATTAVQLNETFTGRLFEFYGLGRTNYMDCEPAYKPERPKRIRGAKS